MNKKQWSTDLLKEEMVDAVTKLLKVKTMSKNLQYIIRIGLKETSKGTLYSMFFHQMKQLEKILNHGNN